MKLLVLLILGVVAVEAIFRPDYYKKDDCDDDVTKKPEYRCPANWTLYHRNPSFFNDQTSLWCMRVIPILESVSVQTAASVCAREGATLSNYENEAERLAITAEAQKHIEQTLGKQRGSIAVGGARVKECQSANKTLLSYPPCNDKKTLFYLPDKHTNPDYTWTTYSWKEPNSVVFNNEVEQCLQLHIEAANPIKHGLINDIFCGFAASPIVPDNDLYKNFGALCGKLPDVV